MNSLRSLLARGEWNHFKTFVDLLILELQWTGSVKQDPYKGHPIDFGWSD